MANYLTNQRPASSIASSKSGRLSKQSFMRANDLRAFQRETIMTPLGFKTVKIYTATDENKNCMNKYRPRPKTAIGIENSTDAKKLNKPDNERLLKRASSANEVNKLKNQGITKERPSTASSTLSSMSSSNQSSNSREVIYNSRHPSCLPPNLYLNDKLRSDGKKNRQRSASSRPCEECSSVERYNTAQIRRTKSADTVERFGTLVHCPKFVKGNPFVTHDELDMGQKQYIWGMAKVYSVDKMKSLRQRHYQSTLNYEYMKRVTTRGVEKKDRIKLWKEYLEYQKVIDRFGKHGPKRFDHSTSSSYSRAHSHAKKHQIVGWTTEVTDDNDYESSSSNDFLTSSNEDSFIYTDDETASTEEEHAPMLEEKLCLNRNYAVDRPKSSKYRIRKPLTSTAADDDAPDMVTQDIEIDEILSGEVADKMSLRSEEENFI